MILFTAFRVPETNFAASTLLQAQHFHILCSPMFYFCKNYAQNIIMWKQNLHNNAFQLTKDDKTF